MPAAPEQPTAATASRSPFQKHDESGWAWRPCARFAADVGAAHLAQTPSVLAVHWREVSEASIITSMPFVAWYGMYRSSDWALLDHTPSALQSQPSSGTPLKLVSCENTLFEYSEERSATNVMATRL